MAKAVTGIKNQSSGKWRGLRRVVQILFLFFFLFVTSDIFFHLDPLTAISSMIASRDIIPPMMLCLITLLATVVFGRAWCGWICPLGTLLDWIPSLRRKFKKPDIQEAWRRQVKNILLLATILSAILGSLTLLFLDPITIFLRTMASVVIPLTNTTVNASEEWLYGIAFLRPAVEWLDGVARSTILTNQPFYLPSLWAALPLAAILALNVVRKRFWCRYLCPLGAMLGLVSRFSAYRPRAIDGQCTRCSRCAQKCPMGAIKVENEFKADLAECIFCLNCVEVCPDRAVSFSRGPALPSYEPSRRRLFISAGAAVVGTALLRIPSISKNKPPSIRPPGSSEDLLLSRCIRCGECIKACPTGALQPGPASWDGFWTPQLMPRTGYCDYACNACGKVCPTRAIVPLNLPEKQKAVIGRAVIDEKRCIPFAEGRECIVCEEMCPIPEKAIKLESISTNLKGPRVERRLCTGCGICEFQCPLNGESAIRVIPEERGKL